MSVDRSQFQTAVVVINNHNAISKSGIGPKSKPNIKSKF